MPKPKDDNNTDDILSRLEGALDDIELQELVKGITADELEEKGFIGKKPVEIERAGDRPDEKTGIRFEKNVEYERLPDNTRFEEISLESLMHLKDVPRGALIASRGIGGHARLVAGKNIVLETKEDKEIFFAAVTGKIVLINDFLYVFPSTRDSSVEITVSPDNMSVAASCTPAFGEGAPLTEQAVRSRLMEKGIVHGIIDAAITKTVEAANRTLLKQENVELAHGTPPRKGRAGSIEYSFDTTPREYDFKILPDGRIDYKSSVNIVMAAEGELLAQIIDPGSGTEGKDVYGHAILAEDGEPVSLTAGAGVTVSDDGKRFTSSVNGSVILNGSLLDVVNTYLVKGDVDYSTGNIDFNGNVFIAGNVLDGFEVKADGDIVIAKNIESARAEAGRDIVIKGGVQGKGKGLISAGRDIRAGYVQNGRLEAQGDIIIRNFTVNSYVFTSGQLIMQENRGAIIGGEVFARRGIDVRLLGSESGVKTLVETGTDFLVLKKIRELDLAIENTQHLHRKIEDGLKSAVATLRSSSGIPESRKAVIRKAFEKRADLETRIRVMQAKRDDLVVRSKSKETSFIKVSARCHQDVHIKIQDASLTVNSPRDNVRFYEDKKSGEILTGAY